MLKKLLGYLCISSIFIITPAYSETLEYKLIIQDHQFNPQILEIPEGQRAKLIIENKDITPEEFESHDLNREKIIPGKSKAIIYIGPLKAKTYSFFGEFNPNTAQGKIIVK